MTTNFFHPSLLLLFLDPGSGMAKNQDPASGINIWIRNTGISCLDSSLGRVPAYDACDPGPIPGGGKLNVCLQGPGS
jgi:hypothetical protein